MKLLRVLVLVALPLYCFAGSGCPFLEEVVNKTISPEVSVSEYQNFLQDFAQTTEEKEALADAKQCFLNQSNETLHNFAQMMQIMYSSILCAIF
ncbi:mammaglobin-A-like isoform X2 [Prionailurus bengalensis]|uniref:mammaglobin-A-like isoform X2 n=1 Tax=Prionailurus bengalensis TaxID=37029 RepID=UPI001CA92699|nr:mammaglobin-A-like isoform X2 [Prionailurus bengalensis]